MTLFLGSEVERGTFRARVRFRGAKKLNVTGDKSQVKGAGREVLISFCQKHLRQCTSRSGSAAYVCPRAACTKALALLQRPARQSGTLFQTCLQSGPTSQALPTNGELCS